MDAINMMLRALLLVLLVLASAARAQDGAVVAREGLVVAQEGRAARVGRDVLARGGNAVDAAVAVGFALAVTHPQAGNLGGGGFMLVHLADRNETVAIDYREKAPQAIGRDTFLDANGNADPEKSRFSALAIGVPGTVAGLALAHARYGSGRFTFAELVEPALTLARNGFSVENDLADKLPGAQARLARWPSTARVFLRSDGTVLAPGDLLVQADLAASLDLIARKGPAAFYDGPIGEKIAAAVSAAGGVMTMDDLRAYQPTVREVLRGTYRGYDIAAMPPPSAGGTLLLEMLNILERYASIQIGSERLGRHLAIEAMRLAYADRAQFLGDPDSVSVPVERLISKAYAFRQAMGIDAYRARPSLSLGSGEVPHEGDHTTHFSIVDRFGNAVANTYTLNFNFGVGLVAEGTGILLNNELDDFSAKKGAVNAFGLTGGDANAPGPGKRPLSSMTPTFLFKDGKVFLVTGSPGGSRITTIVLQLIVNAIDRQLGIAAAVAAPRLHHQWLPDEVEVEPGIAPDIVHDLMARGHTVVERPPWGSANSIMATPEGLAGAADPRVRGALAIGE
jgi:gamma-glutamyltranspeptidase/glutathione hydrolase